MKKIVFATMLGSALFLGACGSDTASITESEEAETTEEAAEVNEEQVEAEEAPEEVEEVVEETASEDVQEDSSMKATNTYTDKELGITGEVGGIKYEISGIQLKVIVPKDEATAELFEVSVGEEVHAFTIQLAGENTKEEDMNFYLGQATAITNTKEQLEPDMFLSEYIEGEYLGQVRHEGYNVYVLKNSTVDQLETVELRIAAPSNSNWDTVGEDVSHVIEVNK